jgi:imidazolonepropionase-like amidohydrolase
MMKIATTLSLAAAVVLIAAGCAGGNTARPAGHAASYSDAERASDSIAALAVFRSNIGSIHQRDRPAYLRHYLQSPRLVRAGGAGAQYGYEGLASGDPDSWPDTLVASHFEVTPLSPGVVYGVYRYRVVDGGSQRGVSERVITRQPDGSWKIAVSTAFAAPGDRPVPSFALTGATIVDGTGAAGRTGTVVMRDGRIACVGECALEADVEPIDVTGRFIMPGLVDAHVHYGQTGWADGRPDALDLRERFPYEATIATLAEHPERFFRSYLCSGVTATFDVGGFPWSLTLGARTEQSTSAPHVSAAGPLLSTRDHWLNLPAERQFIHMNGVDETRAGARSLISRGAAAIKVWYLVSPSDPDSVAWRERLAVAAAEARAAEKPLLVHATSLWAAKDALRAGAHLLVHSVEDALVDDEFVELARANGTFYNPTLTVRDGYLQLATRRFTPDFPLACVDPETRRRARLTDSIPGTPPPAAYAERINRAREIMQENLRRVHAAGIPVVLGTDAGNPLTLHGPSVFTEMEAMAAAGLTPGDVLVASTRDAARAMGRPDFGTLEVGSIANLLVLDDDPLQDIANVRTRRLIVRAGEIWTREELEYRD